MRTKTLLLGLAAGALTLANSYAQVYSVNIVGYVNVTINKGWTIIANPLKASPDQTIATVIPAPAMDIQVYKLNTTAPYDPPFFINAFSFGVWLDPNMTFAPGEALYVWNDPAAGGVDFTLTFVGDVLTGTQDVPVVSGWNLIGSKIPQAGALTTDLGYPAGDGDTCYKWDVTLPSGTPDYTGNYAYVTYSFGVWDPEPQLKVGEGFYLYRDPLNGATTWSRTFNVQ